MTDDLPLSWVADAAQQLSCSWDRLTLSTRLLRQPIYPRDRAPHFDIFDLRQVREAPDGTKP
ncbi:hypothetical protein [Jiella sp. M17.18]|uniref:hypothetical protein n=1 Tax=Jiella sp. M17.18 TaxID=3234247 RepID=UPI0034DE0E25